MSRAASYPAKRHPLPMQKGRNFFVRVSERLREREPLKWREREPTLDAIGALIGIRQPSVSKWKAGGLPEMKHAVAIAEKLGVCVEWLLTERGPKYPSQPDSGLQAILALWSAREDIRDELVRYAAYLATTQPAQKKKSA